MDPPPLLMRIDALRLATFAGRVGVRVRGRGAGTGGAPSSSSSSSLSPMAAAPLAAAGEPRDSLRARAAARRRCWDVLSESALWGRVRVGSSAGGEASPRGPPPRDSVREPRLIRITDLAIMALLPAAAFTATGAGVSEVYPSHPAATLESSGRAHGGGPAAASASATSARCFSCRRCCVLARAARNRRGKQGYVRRHTVHLSNYVRARARAWALEGVTWCGVVW